MKLPKIIKLPSGSYHAVVMLDGERISITDETPELVAARVMSLKAGLIEAKKHPDKIILKDACLKYIESAKGRLSPSSPPNTKSLEFQGFFLLYSALKTAKFTQFCVLILQTDYK
jgi:hypothetical protein